MNNRREKYVRDCLEIIDGSAEAGIRRIGTDGFERTVREVMNALPQRKKSERKPDLELAHAVGKAVFSKGM